MPGRPVRVSTPGTRRTGAVPNAGSRAHRSSAAGPRPAAARVGRPGWQAGAPRHERPEQRRPPPVDVVERNAADASLGATAARERPRRPVFVLVLALVALVSAALLPLAPVQMSTPTVSWPQDPVRPVSTMLELTNLQPRSLDISFSCAA